MTNLWDSQKGTTSLKHLIQHCNFVNFSFYYNLINFLISTYMSDIIKIINWRNKRVKLGGIWIKAIPSLMMNLQRSVKN